MLKLGEGSFCSFIHFKRPYYAADIAPVNPHRCHRVNLHQLLIKLIRPNPGCLFLKFMSIFQVRRDLWYSPTF